MEDYFNISPKCLKFLRGFWEKEEIRGGLNDPIKFARKVVNPFLKELSREGEEVLLVYLDRKGNKSYLKLKCREYGLCKYCRGIKPIRFL